MEVVKVELFVFNRVVGCQWFNGESAVWVIIPCTSNLDLTTTTHNGLTVEFRGKGHFVGLLLFFAKGLGCN